MEQKEKLQDAKVEVIESNSTENFEMFTIINHNGEYMIGLGNQIITRKRFETAEKAQEYIIKKPWELIFNSCAVMFINLMKEQQTNK